MPGPRLVGKLPFVGATNNTAGGIVEFTATWYASDGTTVINAACSATIHGGSLKHGADIKRLKDGKGARCTVLANDEDLTLEINAVPFGSSFANLVKAATLPGALSFVAIANAPVIPGPLDSDTFNSANWLYEGGGTIEFASESEWSLKFTVVRSLNITKQAVVALV